MTDKSITVELTQHERDVINYALLLMIIDPSVGYELGERASKIACKISGTDDKIVLPWRWMETIYCRMRLADILALSPFTNRG